MLREIKLVNRTDQQRRTEGAQQEEISHLLKMSHLAHCGFVPAEKRHGTSGSQTADFVHGKCGKWHKPHAGVESPGLGTSEKSWGSSQYNVFVSQLEK